MNFIHVTDTHLTIPGERLYELDPLERLNACIADINSNQPDAAFCVITGDLTHWGHPEAYAGLRQALSALAIPVHLMLGNHDNRVNFRAAFPTSPVDENGFVQQAFETEAGRFLLLDTNEPEQSFGQLCGPRLDWLAARLAEDHGPVYLFLHHPPSAVFLKRMDEIALQEPERLWQVLEPHRARIRHMFFGHLHRPLSGSWRGIPFSSLRGTNHQVALDFVTEKLVPGSHEPPAYSVVFLMDGNTIVHTQDFLDASPRFFL